MYSFYEYIVNKLGEGISNRRTIRNFYKVIKGYIIRDDELGITSCIRALGGGDREYDQLLHFFESGAVKIPEVEEKWCEILQQYTVPFKIDGRVVMITDTKKISKEGKKQVGVKAMTQNSNNVKKPKTVLGNEILSTGILGENPLDPTNPNFYGMGTHLCQDVDSIRKDLPAREIDQSYGTIIDQTIQDLRRFRQNMGNPLTFLGGDAYYMKAKLVQAVQEEPGCALISKMRSDSVGYKDPLPKKPGTRGPQAQLGEKVKLMEQFENEQIEFKEATLHLYGKKRKVRYACLDLMWNKDYRFKMRFVLTQLLDKDGNVENTSILGCTDQTISPITIITVYAWRAKIELFFRDSNQHMGLESYHFWSSYLPKLKSRQKGDPPSCDLVDDPEAREALARSLKKTETHFLISLLAYGITQLIGQKLMQANIKESDIIYKRTYSADGSISIWMSQLFMKNNLFDSPATASPSKSLS